MFDFVLQRSFLEAFVVIGVAVTVIGIYWRIILIGGAALAFIVVLINHTSEAEVKPNIQIAQVVEPKQEVISEVIISDSSNVFMNSHLMSDDNSARWFTLSITSSNLLML